MASAKKNTTQKQNQARKNPSQPVSNIQQTVPASFRDSISAIVSHKYFVPAIIFLLCLLLYGNTLQNEYACDDGIYTKGNEFIVKGFSAFKDIFDKGSLYGYDKNNPPQYRPLILLNFMTEIAIFGFNPHISHFFNILFFAFTVVLLYFFLQKILKNYNPAIIIAATLLFAFHPIHTEVVANIKSRDEILGLLFGLLSFYFIMLYQEQKKNSYYFYSLAAFFIAIFCKESCLTFIAIIPLLLYFFTGLKIKDIILKSLPYLGLVGIYLFVRSLVLPNITFTNQLIVINNVLMAASNTAERTATTFELLGKYFYMTVIPYPLSWDYSYRQIPVVSWGNIMPILSLLVCAALIVFMLLGFRKKSVFSFSIAFFAITLLLSSNLIIKIASTFGERFLYTPSLGFCIVLPILTAKALKLNLAQFAGKRKIIFFILMACILIVYTIIVIPRNAEWKNDFTLYSSGVIASPNSGKAHQALAIIYVDSAQGSQNTAKKAEYNFLAIREFKKGSELSDLYAECYYVLGECYGNEGYQDSAIPEYKKTLELKPKLSAAAKKLAMIYFNKGQNDSALHYLFLVYKSDSNDIDALKNLGGFYQNAKNYGLAFHYDSLLLKRSPDDKPTLSNMSLMRNELETLNGKKN